jgi:DNA-binding MarR family transcriptional regulator
MAKIDVAKMWSLNYRVLTSVITGVAPCIAELGVDVKELFLLAEVDDYPHPAALAEVLLIPKPTVTLHVKRLEAQGLLRRDIDREDLRRHRLTLTADGRKVAARGMALLSEAYGERLGRLTAAQQAELKALLEKLS